MTSIDALEKMCEPTDGDITYFRPYVCKGSTGKHGIFVVGINPATAILSTQVTIDQYVSSLNNPGLFDEIYSGERTKTSVNSSSRTRLGINSFVKWLGQYTEMSILETNVNAYPAPNYRSLKSKSEAIKRKGYEIFRTVIMEYEPRILIFHSVKAIRAFNNVLEVCGLSTSQQVNTSKDIGSLEKESPLYDFCYKSGKEATVMACRHLRLYGYEGNSYNKFKTEILRVLEKNMT